MVRILLLISLFASLSSSLVSAQDTEFILKGYVSDTNGEPLINATIHTQINRYAVTDTTGFYQINIPQEDVPSYLELRVRYVAKSTYRKTIPIPDYAQEIRHDVVLESLDLYMDDLTVTAELSDERASNTTYVIDRMAIEQSQAYSLANLLQLVPGQTIMNPNLQSAKTITFRSAAEGTPQLNNAFGISLYLNGQSINNNTNMQSLNPIANGGYRTFGGSRSETGEYGEGMTAGGGFDLRQLPVGNIEKVEVVQGVASAEYGDISEGGIFIETTAGRSPWNVTFRRSGGETSLGIDKGVQLHPKHALNVSADYLYSNADPRDRVKTYNRLSGSILWTGFFGQDRQVRNTLSMSYGQNLDDFKTDPDLGPTEITYYQNKRFSISNRIRIQANRFLFDNLSYSVSANLGKSESFLDEFINPGVKPVIDAMEEGVHEGTYHPASYRSQRQILGKPVSLGSRLNFNRGFFLDNWEFILSYGGNINFDANYGKGRVFDPLRPVPQNRAVSRPISYKEMQPESLTGGVYIESKIDGEIGGRRLISTVGVRGDIMHGYQTISPRINTRFELAHDFFLTGAFGIHTKAPGLIHLYPGPEYEDYSLLNSYTGFLKESIHLVYTRISREISEDLEPMKSYRSELGFAWNKERFRWSTTVFLNISDNGIATETRPEFLDLPIYEIVERNQDEKPIVRDTGEKRRVVYEQGYFTNSLYSRSMGIEISASIPKIEALQTSFRLNVSYVNSYYFNQDRNFELPGDDTQPTEEIWSGVYPPNKSQGGEAKALLTSTHHISELGLLLSIRSEAFLYNYSKTLANSNRAIAYVNNEAEIIPIDESEINDPRFDILDKTPEEGDFNQNPSFVYFNFHANISKNISRSVRLSFYANNFLNIRPEVFNSEGLRTDIYNQPPYFGMELRLTL